MATMVAVAGGKGGSGKTTTALGLLQAAAADGTAALAVDADADMPDLHRLAGVDRAPGLGDGPPDEVGQPVPGAPGAGVVAAPTDGEVSVAALSRVRRAAPLSFVDAPAGVGRDAAVPLRAADTAVVVTTPSPAGLRDAARTAAMARALETPVAGAVVSRADRPPDGLESLFDAPVLAAVPAVDAPLSAPAALQAHERVLSSLPERTGNT
ncbi:MAG: cell division inhibitor MinD [Halobacteriales archaeon]